MRAEGPDGVLVTRTRPEAEETAARVQALGFTPLIAPMLDIVATGAAADLEGVQAIVFTSANGARAFAAATPRRNLRALAVGDTSAAVARAAGFTQVESAGGDAAALAALATARLDPNAGPVLHARGVDVAGDLAGRLAAAGFAVRTVTLYEARPVARLPEEAIAGLRDGRIAFALFHSRRGAQTFVRLAEAAPTERTIAVALSAAAAEPLGALAWRAIRVAAAPQEEALLRLLGGEG